MKNLNVQRPPMIYRRLGHSGLKISCLSLGSWVSFDYQIDVNEVVKLLSVAVDAGINLYVYPLLHSPPVSSSTSTCSFDCAEVYAHGKAEEILGKALKRLNIRRQDYLVSTKIFFGDVNDPAPTARGLSRKHILEGLRTSLHRLNLEYVDIVFAHRPDLETSIEETVRAFNWCIDHGLCFYWGTSEWPCSMIEEAQRVADRLGLIGPVVEQPQYSMIHRYKVEEEYKHLTALGLTTWSPLASGVLTGKYGLDGDIPEGSRFTLERYSFLKDRYLQEGVLNCVEKLKPIAAKLDCSLSQLALAWCLKKSEAVSSVIMGATKVEQLEENLGCLRVLPALTDEVMDTIEVFLPPPAAP